jgi:hypothetical protein
MEKIFDNIFKKPLTQKIHIFLQRYPMQNQVVKVMVPEWLRQEQRKVILHVFI